MSIGGVGGRAMVHVKVVLCFVVFPLTFELLFQHAHCMHIACVDTWILSKRPLRCLVCVKWSIGDLPYTKQMEIK